MNENFFFAVQQNLHEKSRTETAFTKHVVVLIVLRSSYQLLDFFLGLAMQMKNVFEKPSFCHESKYILKWIQEN